jgi:hypothetical protein
MVVKGEIGGDETRYFSKNVAVIEQLCFTGTLRDKKCVQLFGQ